MIGLDTNVLVRLLVRDDAKQAVAAQALLETRCSPEEPGFINSIVLCELFWVLETAYEYERRDIAKAIGTLLRVSGLTIERADAVWAALKEYQEAGTDFADGLLSRINIEAGCEYTMTFDRAATKSAGFRLIDSR
ncbi:MAG: type II toxin-antitoxin system VapC family toxin [Candidatus Eremiobacteraeota bacterium]|nr:type II toxin-antitoxin system VapC family toxin [Candidatus Eremiobacteraeota bacterium]MBC5827495.1 type II toxin-antitoxin system VapC family toxin [Candidatus Eremiobacteraeota bacterium]